MNMEFWILNMIQTIRTPFLDSIMPWISFLADNGYIWIVLSLVLLIFKKTRRLGCILALSLIIDVLLCNCLIKPIVARIRPFDINTTIELIIEAPKDYSFPSGHTAASFSMVFALIYAKETRYIVPVIILSCLIAFSRMYLYVHYPTDIIGGIALGLVNGYLANVLYRLVKNNRINIE